MGGWIGYVWAFGACFLVLGLIAMVTLVLYGVARMRGTRDTPRVRVISLQAASEPDGDAP